ncbi:MAG: SDR family oxidoreductase [Actinomycetota bacterium]|nr:SDR family oxidoreductase [Actinomycetota bacterium]
MLGTHLVRLLRERGHEVRVLSRRPGAGTHLGDLGTGEGVAEAALGAELVLHAASDTRRRGRSDPQQTRQLLAATEGVRQLLYVSIVGIDAIELGYYKRKLACERAIAAGSVPYTILRATQFHELLAFVLERAGRLPLTPLPLDWRFQSAAAQEVAARAVDLLEGEPHGRAPDFGGPEVLSAREIVEPWRELRGRPRRIVDLRLPGRVSRAFRQGLNTSPDRAEGRQRWTEFIATLPG